MYNNILYCHFRVYNLLLSKRNKKIQDIEEASRSTYELVSKKDEDVVKSYIRKTERANQLLNKNRLFYNAVSGLFLLTILMIIFNNISIFGSILYFIIMILFGYLIARRFNRKLFKFSVNSTLKGYDKRD